MKVTITENEIAVETEDDELPLDHDNMIDWSCRLASHEVCAWAMKRLGEEMEKSVRFYRTGTVSDKIGMN